MHMAPHSHDLPERVGDATDGLPTRRLALLGAGALAVTAGAAAAGEADYPTQPIRLVVPFVPGGGADTNARLVAEPLGRELGQSVVVENRGGAGGTIGTAAVARAPADGYTLLYGTPGTLITNQFLLPSLPYDPEKDFEPVSLLTKGAYVMAVHKDLPVRNVAELIALAKERPGTLTYASSGTGAGSHLAGELLSMVADIQITHVPYRGTGPALQDVASGRVSFAIDSYAPMIPHLQAGNMRPIAVTSLTRHPDLPEVPTVAETLPGFEVTVVNFICVRAGTPKGIIERLNRAIVKVLNDPTLQQRMRAAGSSQPHPSTPEELGEILRTEREKWREIIARAGIRAG